MTHGQYISEPEAHALEGVEGRLFATLAATSDEVAHTECLDEEERAEVYAILHAIRSDTEAHRKAIRLISTRRPAGDA